MIAGTARAPAYRVAIGGFGTIGAKVARRLDEGIPGLELAAVSARDRAAAADRMKALNRPVPVLTLSELAAAADVVVECAPAAAFDEVARERITFDKAMIGSCTNGSYDDLLSAALVLLAARGHGLTRAQREFVVFPGSGGVKLQIERPDPRLNGESIADVFRSVGGQIRASWCGPCFGQGPDALSSGQRAITSFNRNWQNRMGYGGEGYLASPAVVAASALAGYMAPPSELGLKWDAERYGV